MAEACYILSHIIGQEGEFEVKFRREKKNEKKSTSCLSLPQTPSMCEGKEEVMVEVGGGGGGG